jgi:hypothetical protein
MGEREFKGERNYLALFLCFIEGADTRLASLLRIARILLQILIVLHN